MVHPMGLSLTTELEYRRARLVRTGRSLPQGSRGTRRAERAELAAAAASRATRTVPATAGPRVA